ncbi:MAG: MFS transporter [Nitriliruptoraceae bacterium]
MLPLFLVGALSLQIREDILITAAQLGLIAGVYFLVSASMSIPLGRLAQRWGPIRSFRVSGVVLMLGSLCIGVLAQTWQAVFLGVGIVGVANALAQPAGNVALAKGVSNARGLAFGVKQASVPIAALSAGVAVPIAASFIGWRAIFVAVGAGALIAGFLAKWITETPTDRTVQPPVAAKNSGKIALFPLLMFALGGMMAGAAATSFGFFFVQTAVSAGWEEIPAGRLFAIASFGSISVRIAAGWAVDRFHLDGFVWMASLLAVGSTTFLLLGFSRHSFLFGMVYVAGFAFGWGWPGLFLYTVATKNQSRVAVASGIAQAGVWVGGVVGPYTFGMIADRWSFSEAFFGASMLCLLGVIFVLYSKSRYDVLERA